MRRVARLLFENLMWKLLALSIAVLLWALVASEPELSTFEHVRLEYKNLPEGIEIASDPVDTVTLELRGPSGELRGVADSGIRPAVILDMSGVRPGERTFPIGNASVRLSRSVRLLRAIPSEVRLRFDRTVEHTVPVHVRFSGEGAHGYVVARSEVTPKEVRIAGPASRVNRISSVLTDPVDVSTATGSSEFHVNAFLEDPFVRFQSSPQVTVDVTMAKK